MPRDYDDDEDDRPRRRRYDDDRPQRRRDDDDRRRRRRDDDDNFDRPPPRKSGAWVVWLVLGIVAGVFLVIAIPLVIFLLPAIQKVREAGSRMASANNLKQASLGAHNFESTTNSFPRPFLDTDRQGVAINPPADPNSRLSWRVALLPFLGEPEYDSTYQRFNIREPWNSSTNAPLKDVPIRAYRHPLDAQEKGEPVTRIRCFYDNGALFESKPHAQLPFTAVPDGLSHTIMYIESADKVSWTAFNDFRYDPNTPLPKFGHPNVPGGFNVSMGDGSVRFVRHTVAERTLRQAITRADGMVIMDPDW